MIKVEIDSNSGFCGGVIRAIDTAERFLWERDGRLFSLGAIVHNEEELERLGAKGLVALAGDEIDDVVMYGVETILIRAHGVAPEIYEKLRLKGFEIIDCTCPVVLNIQKQIRRSAGQVLIFGKHGHPEVLGLVGQNSRAKVFDSLEQLEDALAEINPEEPLDVFSQTTMSPVQYKRACDIISRVVPGSNIHNTICKQVASRHGELSTFAREHDAVIFVTGSHSSNGKVLYDLCKSENPRTWRVSAIEDIKPEWFRPGDFVGVSGATSTPKWLLEKVASAIENLQ